MAPKKNVESSILKVDVALPLPVGKTYTYSVPQAWVSQIQVGCRVLVPVRNRDIIGFVVQLQPARSNADLKELKDILDQEPLFDSMLLRLTRWVSEYYLCPWGDVLKAALPAGIHVGSHLVLRLKEPYSRRLIEKADRAARGAGRILQVIHDKGEIRFSQLKKATAQDGLGLVLKTLEKKGYISLQPRLEGQRVRASYETWVELVQSEGADENHLQHLGRKAPRQETCLRLLLQAEDHRLSAAHLHQEHAIDRRVLLRLEKEGLVRLVQSERMRDPYSRVMVQKPPAVVLTPAQKGALRRMTASIARSSFKVFLLHGVTGSGKTEVYIRSVQEVLRQGKQAIVLVPEISLTSQTVGRFRAHCGDCIAVLHSRLSLGERYDMWRRIRQGDVDIVIGARSAVFAPVQRLGLIVVDEEHEGTYKQSDSLPRYHARDIAIVRAQHARAVVVLGSATPSIESYHNALMGKYALETLPQRVDDRPLPPVSVVDMRQERLAGSKGFFSVRLREKIKERLGRGEQIILLLNRRGFSSYIQCEQCGYVAMCRNCDVTLSYHAAEGSLRCHYCDARRRAPSVCPKCSGHRLRYGGVGTQRIEKELQHLFPDIRTLRMDTDTTQRKGAHDRILNSFDRGRADVLLGTQMVAKGLDFPRVTLVGVIDADVGLNLPDFRACERTFQLLTQVAGRTGRSELGGEVVIQTFSPDHPAITLAKSHDYPGFFNREIQQRQELGYPPYNRLVSILVRGEDEGRVEQHARHIVNGLTTWTEMKTGENIRILGPAPAPLGRVLGRYRWQIILKGGHPGTLHQAVARALASSKNDSVPGETTVSVDVDPVDML